MDLLLLKEKEKLLTAHAVEMEQHDEHTKYELKRLQTHLETRHREEFVKVKHMHEMELGRSLREVEKLTKLLARATGSVGSLGNESSGVAETSNSGNLVEDSGGARAQNKNQSLIKDRLKHLEKQEKRHLQKFSAHSKYKSTALEDDLPPPPPPASHPRRTPGSNKWDSLNKSLIQQEHRHMGDADNKTSTSLSQDGLLGLAIPPPEAFPLDDAFAHSNIGKERNPLYVSDNMGKVNSYMDKLQRYLQDYDVVDEPTGPIPAYMATMSVPDTEINPTVDGDVVVSTRSPFMDDDDEGVLSDSLDFGSPLDEDDRVVTRSTKPIPVSSVNDIVFSRGENSGSQPQAKVATFTAVPSTNDDKYNTTDQLLGSSTHESNGSGNVTLNSDALNLLAIPSSGTESDSRESDQGSSDDDAYFDSIIANTSTFVNR